MNKFNIKFCIQKAGYFECSLLSLFFLINSISVTEAKPSKNNNLKISTIPQEVVELKAFGKDSSNNIKGKLPTKDGTYSYGQSPERNRIGQEYMVFEMHQGKVIGAFYLPQSEFSCFQGSFASGRLSMSVASDSTSDPAPDFLAERNSPKVAATGDGLRIEAQYQQMASSYAVALKDYYQIPSVSANEQRILSVCKNSYQH